MIHPKGVTRILSKFCDSKCPPHLSVAHYILYINSVAETLYVWLSYSAYRKYIEEGNFDNRSEKRKKKYGSKLAVKRNFAVQSFHYLLLRNGVLASSYY